MVFRSTVQKKSSKVRLKNVTAQKCNEIIKYQLPPPRFDQISDYKHDIYFYGKLFTNAQPAVACSELAKETLGQGGKYVQSQH